jgi:ornithine cyclodeaminase/alanine dehydrogenase-like protein (mu-crystallin family)
MTLYLSEQDIDGLLTPEDALEAVEGSFRRLAEGVVENVPRRRLRLDGGMLAVMSATDLGLGVAGVKTYAAGRGGASFVIVLFDVATDELLAVIAADRIGQYRTGAASGVAAKYLARREAKSLGLIGAGLQAEMQLRAIRAALPGIEEVVVYSRRRTASRPWRRRRRLRRRTSSSRSRTRATRSCGATGCGPARSSARQGRTGRRPASSTTRCSSGRPSCAATRSTTQRSSRAT